MRKVVSLAHEVDTNADALTLAQAAAAQLLERSVFFGHRRLSVVRLNIAAQLGTVLPVDHWNHCAKVAMVSSDARVRALFLDAVQVAQRVHDFRLPDLDRAQACRRANAVPTRFVFDHGC